MPYRTPGYVAKAGQALVRDRTVTRLVRAGPGETGVDGARGGVVAVGARPAAAADRRPGTGGAGASVGVGAGIAVVARGAVVGDRVASGRLVAAVARAAVAVVAAHRVVHASVVGIARVQGAGVAVVAPRGIRPASRGTRDERIAVTEVGADRGLADQEGVRVRGVAGGQVADRDLLVGEGDAEPEGERQGDRQKNG